jgi:hypothetical protein
MLQSGRTAYSHVDKWVQGSELLTAHRLAGC